MPVITIKVDHAACSGIASCHDVSPAFFQLNGGNRAVVVSGEVGESFTERTITVSDTEAQNIITAAESCPMIAVSVFGENGELIHG
jgi:ferredoxin